MRHNKKSYTTRCFETKPNAAHAHAAHALAAHAHAAHALAAHAHAAHVL